MLEAVFDTVFNGEMLVYQKKRKNFDGMAIAFRFDLGATARYLMLVNGLSGVQQVDPGIIIRR